MLKKITLFTITLFIASCGLGQVDFWVGPTPVELTEGAKEQVPCDFVESLREIQKFISERFGENIANDIMSKKIVLYPDYATPPSRVNPNLYLNGITEDGKEIHIRLLGPSILQTALIHEMVAHLVCHKVYDDVNVNHDNAECMKLEGEATLQVYERTQSVRESRCAEEYWR